MALRLPDRWIWDSWYVWDGDVCHAFYLCASRGLYDPDRRHRNTNIGHAVSRDLVTWEVLPDALSPSESPAFDSWTTWTGSTVRGHDGKWWMFYTGTSRETAGKVQSIGAAVSEDLITWHKLDNPLVVADENLYEKVGQLSHDGNEHWRDPWVFWDAESEIWRMLITARAKDASSRYAGVAGHAQSKDLLNWEILQPLSVTDSGFANLEVLQFAEVDGVGVVVFCCGWREYDDDRLSSFGKTDYTFSVPCPSVSKGIDFRKAKPFTHQELYAARLIQKPTGEWFLIGFVNFRGGKFVGELSDPIPVTADPEIGLVVRP